MAFDYYKLTEEDLLKADTYVSTMQKMDFVRTVAERCFDKLDITASEGDEDRPLPSCYKVNTDKKSRYLMGALLKLYLKQDFATEGDDEEYLMVIDEYDKYAGGHIFEMINRMKSNAKTKDIAYNLMADYSELKYRLDSDIKGLLTAMNDSVSRALAYIEASTSPAEMQKALSQMTENQELLDNYMKERNLANTNNIVEFPTEDVVANAATTSTHVETEG